LDAYASLVAVNGALVDENFAVTLLETMGKKGDQSMYADLLARAAAPAVQNSLE
jgi:hypothetical protein